MFIQRPILVVLHVSITLMFGSPANSVYMFQQHPSVSIKMIFKQYSKKAKSVANTRPLQNIRLKQVRLRVTPESVEQIKTKKKMRWENLQIANREHGNNTNN